MFSEQQISSSNTNLSSSSEKEEPTPPPKPSLLYSREKMKRIHHLENCKENN